jgi:hypothetical protein
VVSAIAGGTATITVTTADGDKTATCAVTVVVSVTGVSLSRSTATIGVGQTARLNATISPSNATNRGLTWSSSDGAVATVAATGAAAVVSAVGSGSAMITVSSEDGSKTATCLVMVAMSAQWVRTATTGNSSSTFSSLAIDADGNIYAVGTINGTGSYAFGDSVTAAGSYAGSNALLVKYDASGTARWARTLTAASGASAFTAVATDTSGNLFTVGTVAGAGPYDFGDGVGAAATYVFGSNLVVVEYDSSGTARWARTVTQGSGSSSYAAVATDPSGSLYAAGTVSGALPYGFGNGKAVAGTASGGGNALLVKYSAAGIAQWARSTQSGSGESAFTAVVADGAGKPYVAGRISGTLAFGFGSAVTVAGTGSGNALLVHYDAGGMAQWARTATGGGNTSDFTAIAADAAGSVFVAGSINGHTANDFGTGVTVAGAYALGPSVLLLMYDSSGTAQWGQSAVNATGLSTFASLALDPAGHLYAVGILAGPGSYDFGNSIVAATVSDGNEVLLAKYDSAGICHTAQTATTGSSVSGFSAVITGGASDIYAAGTISGPNPVDFGNSITSTGAYSGGNNAILVKFR